MGKAFKRRWYSFCVIWITVLIGLLLMTGADSTEEQFVEDIFSVRRIKVSPIVTLAGFLTIIAAIMYKPRGEKTDDNT